MAPKRKNPHADSIAANPRAARILAQLVATGAVKPADKAADWYQNKQYAAIFSPCDPEKFRKRFKKLVDEKYGESTAKRKAFLLSLFYFSICSFLTLSFFAASKTRPKTSMMANIILGGAAEDAEDALLDRENDVSGVEGGSDVVPGGELLMAPLQFKPFFVLSEWKHQRTKDNRVSVAILLPTGVGEQEGDVRVSVEDGLFLRVDVVWPPALTNVPMLMEMWLQGDGVPKIEDYHPQVQGFYDYLQQFQANQRDKVESFARLPLPFVVKPDFERHVLGWEGSSQIILFVTLSAPDRNFNPDDKKLVVKILKRSTGGAVAATSSVSQ